MEGIMSNKFLGVLLNDNLSWKDSIKCTDDKIFRYVGILYKARDYLSKERLLSLYYTYLHTCVN